MLYVAVYWLTFVISMGFYEGWSAVIYGPRLAMTIREFASCHFEATLAVGILAFVIKLHRLTNGGDHG